MTFQNAAMASGLALGLLSGAAQAATITYDINQGIGSGSVVGTIETDATIGVISTANIVSFDLTLNGANGVTRTISSTDSKVLISGSDLTSTASNLFFDYGGNDDGFALFQQTLFTGQKYYCNAASSVTCFAGASVVPEAFDSPSAQFDRSLSGNQIIGTATSPVPLPASAPMFGAAILAFGALGYGVTRKTAAAAG